MTTLPIGFFIGSRGRSDSVVPILLIAVGMRGVPVAGGGIVTVGRGVAPPAAVFSTGSDGRGVVAECVGCLIAAHI